MVWPDLANSSKQSQTKRKKLTLDIPANLETTLLDQFCIYRVPATLRKINEAAYTPRFVSIGPIHHGEPELQAMQIQKLIYLKAFCGRRNTRLIKEEEEFSIRLLNEISEEDICHCYADTFANIGSSDEFVNMILLDSIFIIEHFLRSLDSRHYEKDFIISKPWLREAVQQDLILLENQLPFSSLEKLFNFAKKYFVNEEDYPYSLLDLMYNYFSNFKPRKVQILNPEKILHFTDLIRYSWIFNHPPMSRVTIGNFYSIRKLQQAGLKLKPVENKSFLDINFEGGSITCLERAELQFPCFEIDGTTEYVVANIMAFEQCHYPYETYMCNYIRLLDDLIDTAEDVDLLVEKKILVNSLRDSATVANLINKLSNQIAEVHSCYYFLSKELNAYYENWCNQTITVPLKTLKRFYFTDLWRGTATVAAIVLLFLTLTQTICSILAII